MIDIDMDNDDEDDGSGNRMQVDTLEAAEDSDLIEELIRRQRLMVVTARQEFNRSMFDRPGFLWAITSKLAQDIASQMRKQGNLIKDEFEQTSKGGEYISYAVVLTTINEEHDA